MSTAQFDALVAQVEQTAATQPQAYRRRLLGLAALGYGYIALALILLIALAAALVIVPLSGDLEGLAPMAAIQRFGVVALVLPVALTIRSAVLSLFARREPPEGLELTREQTPLLFAFLDEARAAAHAPVIHRVLLHDDFNASMFQVSRLGLLGWQRNYLILGLPIMDTLSPDEFRAVLAHEIGHLTNWNDRLADQIYEVRSTWGVLWESIQQNHLLARLVFEPFFRWYYSHFLAYSSVLVRQHELAADQLGARLVGGRIMADGLVRIRLTDNHLNATFWPSLCDAPKDQPATPSAHFTDLATLVRQPRPAAEIETELAAALSVNTDSASTHPCLRERLAALGQEPRIPETPATSAAEELLGETLPALRQLMNETWRAEANEWWQEQAQEAREHRAELATLEARAAEGPLKVRDQWRRVQLIDVVRGAEACIAELREFLRQRPRFGIGYYQLGRLLLKLKQDEGLTALETSVRLDPTNVEIARDMIAYYLCVTDRDDELELFGRWLDNVAQRLERDADKIFCVRPDREYQPHGLSPDEIAPILDSLDRLWPIYEAYLVRFVWPAFPEVNFYLLEMVREPTGDSGSHDFGPLVSELYDGPELPSKTLIHVHRPKEKRTLEAIKAVEGALIYERAARDLNEDGPDQDNQEQDGQERPERESTHLAA